MTAETIFVPDLGGAESVEVIELCVAEGDSVELEQSLIVLESDKATMDVPSPQVGIIKKMLVAEGDTVSEGTPIAEIETASVAVGKTEAANSETATSDPAPEAVAECRILAPMNRLKLLSCLLPRVM